MTHLSEAEFVDLAENDAAGISDTRAAHAETCAPCRAQVDALRAMLRETRAVEVPEPSPLFWEHLSMRVRGGIAAEPVPGRSAWDWIGIRGLVPLAAAAVLIVAVFSGALLVRAARDGAPPIADRSVTAPAASVPGRPDAIPDAENAEVWAVLTAAASTLKLEDARDAGMHVPAAAIERAVQDLTAAEMAELGRLLQSELKRSSN